MVDVVLFLVAVNHARYNVETNLWQEIRAGGRPPPARSGAQAGNTEDSLGLCTFPGVPCKHDEKPRVDPALSRPWFGPVLCGSLAGIPRRTLLLMLLRNRVPSIAAALFCFTSLAFSAPLHDASLVLQEPAC